MSGHAVIRPTSTMAMFDCLTWCGVAPLRQDSFVGWKNPHELVSCLQSMQLLWKNCDHDPKIGDLETWTCARMSANDSETPSSTANVFSSRAIESSCKRMSSSFIKKGRAAASLSSF